MSLILITTAAAMVSVAQPPRGMMPEEMSQSDFMERAEERFTKRDENGDGYLTLDEAKSTRERKSPEERFAAADTNGDGQISLDEHKAATEAIFAQLDENGDGLVTREEMRSARKSRRGE